MTPDPDNHLLARIAYGLAAAHVLVGIGVAIADNPEGPVGGVFYVLQYALPLALIGRAIQSPSVRRRRIAGSVALALGVFFALIVVGNWSGYSHPQAIFAVCITVPTTLVDLAIFWRTVPRWSNRT